MLAAIRSLHRLEFVIETLRAARRRCPGWLTANADLVWFGQHATRPENYSLPLGQQAAVNPVWRGVASVEDLSVSVGLLSSTVTAPGMTGLFFIPAAASRQLPDVVRRRSRRTAGRAGRGRPAVARHPLRLAASWGEPQEPPSRACAEAQ
ncbi:hypothetical protein ACFZAT_20580 [Streptomyces sp. NPDC008163]|uniref:hypothetical protein n=1 Tax=Streptomyces sp. NPDC008163 TaxID=3364818 RepID=UPI0036EA7619